jgi:hypothetical protein
MSRTNRRITLPPLKSPIVFKTYPSYSPYPSYTLPTRPYIPEHAPDYRKDRKAKSVDVLASAKETRHDSHHKRS